MTKALAAVETYDHDCLEGDDFAFNVASHAKIWKCPEGTEHLLEGYRKAWVPVPIGGRKQTAYT